MEQGEIKENKDNALAIALTNGGKKEKRRELDFYPTPAPVTQALLDFLKHPPSTIWEPACGDGAMSKVLEAGGHRVISTDIRDSGYGEAGIDFITAGHRPCDAIITNPPFNASVDFILKSLAVAPLVAMLVKSQYWHSKERQALFNNNPPAWILPLTWRPNFYEGIPGKNSPTMECIWTVWIAGQTDTRYALLSKPPTAKLQTSLFSAA